MMWKLDKPSKETQDDYVDLILPGLAERIAKGVEDRGRHEELADEAKDILMPNWNDADKSRWNTSHLKALLINEPADLETKELELMNQLNGIVALASRPNKKLLGKIFNYEGVFNDSTKKRAYWLAKKIGRNTCVYCNRLYVFTVERNGGHNKKDRITRPVFDHWFAKNEHPLLSLSLFNLIPSCTVCNSSAKGSAEFSLNTHIHPYVHKQGHPNITFKVTAAASPKLKWGVTIDGKRYRKENKTKEDLALDEIYTMHGALEVNDLMEFKQKYPDGYLKQLVDDVIKGVKPGYTLNRNDVYRMLFGVEATADKFLDRPLSKMKYDILHDMGVI